jgi:hypothetical protein
MTGRGRPRGQSKKTKKTKKTEAFSPVGDQGEPAPAGFTLDAGADGG